MDLDQAKARIAELEGVLTLICGAFPTKLIGSGDPHMPNKAVQKVCAELRAARDAEITRLQGIIERDRSRCADVQFAVRKALAQHEWLRLGRGSYEYDDDSWKDEFGQAFDNVIKAIEPLRKMAADWSDSPTDQKAIAEARKGLSA